MHEKLKSHQTKTEIMKKEKKQPIYIIYSKCVRLYRGEYYYFFFDKILFTVSNYLY